MKFPSQQSLKEFLTQQYLRFNHPSFIESDPIQIPHRYRRHEDIEIAAFLTAIIAWGQRKSIIANAGRLMLLMGNTPYSFVMDASDTQLERLLTFTHRTFQGEDCLYFIHSLRNIYRNHGGLQLVFESAYLKKPDMEDVLKAFRTLFFELPALPRTGKHISDVSKGAAAKRLNMFLRWMVRKDTQAVDFGIWDGIPSSALYLPLDLHTGNVGRSLGLLLRKQNDWKAVKEITARLRGFDPEDPVKYDYALFGLGVFDHFK